MMITFKEYLLEAGRVHVRPGTTAKRGEPDEPARGLDVRNKDRSAISALKKKGYTITNRGDRQKRTENPGWFGLEMSDEGEWIQVTMMKTGAGSDGVSVIFKPDGSVTGTPMDRIASKFWKDEKDEIIKAAKKALKDPETPGIYDGLGGKSSKRGKGKLSFDIKESVDLADVGSGNVYKVASTFKAKKAGKSQDGNIGFRGNTKVEVPVGTILTVKEIDKDGIVFASNEHNKETNQNVKYFADLGVVKHLERKRASVKEAVELSAKQKQDLLADFEVWSGGYTPDQCPWTGDDEDEMSVSQYIEYGMDSNLPKAAAEAYLEKLCESLNEGKFVVKNKDGKPKSFKSIDSAEAKEWKETSTAKPSSQKVDRTAQADKANQLVWRAISEIDSFGELDWSDLVKMKVLPRLAKGLREMPDAYPEALHDAVSEARGEWGTYDRLIKFFDKAVKEYAREKSWDSYVKSMEDFAGDQG